MITLQAFYLIVFVLDHLILFAVHFLFWCLAHVFWYSPGLALIAVILGAAFGIVKLVGEIPTERRE